MDNQALNNLARDVASTSGTTIKEISRRPEVMAQLDKIEIEPENEDGTYLSLGDFVRTALRDLERYDLEQDLHDS